MPFIKSGNVSQSGEELLLQNMWPRSQIHLYRLGKHNSIAVILFLKNSFVSISFSTYGFSVFASALIDVIPHSWVSMDDSTQDGTSLQSEKESLHSSISSAISVTTGSHSLNHVITLFRELKVPPEFAQLVWNLIGVEQSLADVVPSSSSSSALLVSYMASLFMKCTEHSSLVILAVDDAHQVDHMSWLVLQELYERADNLLIVCTTLSADYQNIAIEKKFWTKINSEDSRLGRFSLIKLGPLTKPAVLAMATKSLADAEPHFCSKIADDVLTFSGGVPHLVVEMLERIKKDLVAHGNHGYDSVERQVRMVVD